MCVTLTTNPPSDTLLLVCLTSARMYVVLPVTLGARDATCEKPPWPADGPASAPPAEKEERGQKRRTQQTIDTR